MRTTILRAISYGISAVVIGLTVAQVTATAQDSEGLDRTIQGVWRVTTTPRNCVTGVPIPTAAFEALFTFHKDGTMSAWLQNSTITTTRSPSFGLWRRENSWSDYSFKFVHLRYNVTTGMFIGRQDSGGSLVLDESGDAITTEGSTQGFDVNGNPSGPGGCSTSVGTRFKLEL